jgi:ABC-type ATPase with predicted acetyltransferase domain
MEKVIGRLIKKSEPLTSLVEVDDYTKAASKAFDLTFNGQSKFHPWEKPIIPKQDFRIGVIYGASGSGKSTLLREFGTEEQLTWDPTKAIVSHFDSEDDALNKLGAVGLNSIPSWTKPYHVLSNGEKFRADLARKIKNNAVIDEFTSVVDRNVAKAASVALSRYVKQASITGLVLATCHEDILDWLQPDWVINTNTGEMYDGFFLSAHKSISKFIAQTVVRGKCLKNITI